MSTDHTSGMSPFDPGFISSELGLPSVSSPSAYSHESLLGAWGTPAATNPTFGVDRSDSSLTSVAIEFRVTRAGTPVRRLRLTGNRYTFGSAEGCSIQLNDPSLRPMHAVLIRDARRILVRAYTVPIEVNESRTTEANLSVGDVIRLGAYRFELLPLSADHGPVRSAISTAGEDGDPNVWRERLRREIDQWRARQSECDRREVQCDDREAALRTRESELWSRAEQLHRRESNLMSQESAALQIQEEYARQQQEVSRLQDEYRAQQEAIEKKETELRSLETEYREQAETTSRQLRQSQEQAETANEAVQRMRDQFAALNQKLEELQTQQNEIEQQEREQDHQNEQLRAELQAAREEATQAQAASEAERQSAEARVEDLDAQLQQARSESEAQRNRADESEETANQLRQQIDELQKCVSDASDEASRLRKDYDEACESVRNLESIIDQGNVRGEQDRESWFVEAEQLRQSVEHLSVDLAKANGELDDLRQSNEALTLQLDELTQQRDDARSELEMRPTTDAIESLRQELDTANQKLTEMQSDYHQTLTQLETAIEENESLHNRNAAADLDGSGDSHDQDAVSRSSSSDASSALSVSSSVAASMLGLGGEIESSSDSDESIDDSTEAVAADASDLDDDQSGWPTYQSVPQESSETDSTFETSDGDGSAFSAESMVDDAQQPDGWSSDESDRDEEGVGWDQTETAEAESLDAVTDDYAGHSNAPAFDSPSSQDDAPQWSPEPKEPQNAPHFASWEEPEDTSHENDFTEQQPAYDAEFDRAIDNTGSDTDTADSTPEQSVDDVITDIEKGVDEAISASVSDVADYDSAAEYDAETSEKTGESTFDDADTDSTAYGWELPAPEADAQVDDSQVESDDLEDHSSFADSDHDAAGGSVTSYDEDTPQQEHADHQPSPWGYESLEPNDSAFSEAEPDAETNDAEIEDDRGNTVESTALWDSQSHQDSAESAVGWDTHEAETSDDQPGDGSIDQPDSQWPQADEEQSSPLETSSLADALIRDLDSESPSETGPSEVDGTYVWERPDSMPEQTPSDQPADDDPISDHQGTGTYAWDQEYPEESRSSEWTNDPEGEHTEIIHSSGLESAIESQELDNEASAEVQDTESDQTLVTNETETIEPAQEDDDSIEAYMNRLLQRVQGEPLADTVTQPIPPVSRPRPDSESVSETSTATTDTSQTTDSIASDAPLVPRSQAPERNSNLSAMRALANESARTAVAYSVRIQARDIQLKGLMKFIQAGVAVLCAAACFFFLDWTLMLKMIVIGAILVITGILVQEGFVLLKDARLRLSAAEHGTNQKTNDEPSAPESSDSNDDPSDKNADVATGDDADGSATTLG